MNRALLFLITITAMVSFGTSAAVADPPADRPPGPNCAANEKAVNNANSRADINGDGCVGKADDAAMKAGMASGDPAADLNKSGSVNIDDWNLFLQAKNS